MATRVLLRTYSLSHLVVITFPTFTYILLFRFYVRLVPWGRSFYTLLNFNGLRTHIYLPTVYRRKFINISIVSVCTIHIYPGSMVLSVPQLTDTGTEACTHVCTVANRQVLRPVFFSVPKLTDKDININRQIKQTSRRRYKHTETYTGLQTNCDRHVSKKKYIKCLKEVKIYVIKMCNCQKNRKMRK